MDRTETKITYSCIIALCIFGAVIFFGKDSCRSRDVETAGAMEVCLPSIESVQQKLNEVIDPSLFEPLEVDGVAGTKTIAAWQFYSTGWNAENERKLCE